MSQNFSAIDIGSNAIRMIVAEWNPNNLTHQLRIIKKWRAPVRLGQDVFKTGSIQPDTLQKAVDAFLKFKQINQKYKVSHCYAVATSASREAKNKLDFIHTIHNSSGIEINIIDGTEEAELIHLAITKEIDLQNKKSMGIDIGGGSVEITFSENGKITRTKSFPMGTVRILDHLQKRNLKENQINILLGEFISPLSEHIELSQMENHFDFAIGTGGNFECLGDLKIKILKKAPNTFLTSKELYDIIQSLKLLSPKERMEKLDLRPDRADVILPAAKLAHTILRQAGCEKILIPCVGLRDGILWASQLKTQFKK